MKKNILLTGCAGFIGLNFVRLISETPDWINQYRFVVLDALTYAGNEKAISALANNFENIIFKKGDIRDIDLLQSLFKEYQFEGIINFAAESHVDNSISNPNIFKPSDIYKSYNKEWGHSVPHSYYLYIIKMYYHYPRNRILW